MTERTLTVEWLVRKLYPKRWLRALRIIEILKTEKHVTTARLAEELFPEDENPKIRQTKLFQFMRQLKETGIITVTRTTIGDARIRTVQLDPEKTQQKIKQLEASIYALKKQ